MYTNFNWFITKHRICMYMTQRKMSIILPLLVHCRVNFFVDRSEWHWSSSQRISFRNRILDRPRIGRALGPACFVASSRRSFYTVKINEGSVAANRNDDMIPVDVDWWVCGRVSRFYVASCCVCFTIRLDRDHQYPLYTFIFTVLRKRNRSRDFCLTMVRYLATAGLILLAFVRRII